jgi:hypothetical protein
MGIMGIMGIMASFGEPMVTRASPTDVEEWARHQGLEIVEHPDHAMIVGRYFAGRPDGLRPHTVERLVRLRVPGATVQDVSVREESEQ